MSYSDAFARMVEDTSKPVVKDVVTKGIADVVLDGKFDPRIGLKIIGHIGFHESDSKPNNQIDLLAQRAATELDTVIAQLETKYGYHLVSFEIMDDEHWWNWKWWMRKNLYNEYNIADGVCGECLEKEEIIVKDNLYYFHCPKCSREHTYTVRILRIDKKGDEPKPSLMAWRIPKSGRMIEMSDKHVLKYQGQGIIGDIPYPYFKLTHTTAWILPYTAKAEVSQSWNVVS